MDTHSAYCTFRVDRMHFCIEVLRVQEVVREQRTPRVAGASPMVRGLMNLRGQIVTAFDLRRRLEIADREDGAPAMNVVVRTPDGPVSLLVSGLCRWTYLLLGWLFVVLAMLGVMLPILPTTPFLLLASWFFMRSNPALRDWLLRLPAFGPLLRNWESHRAVPWQSKLAAYVLVPSMITASIVWGELSWPWAMLLLCVGVIGIAFVSRLRVLTRPNCVTDVRMLVSPRNVELGTSRTTVSSV